MLTRIHVLNLNNTWVTQICLILRKKKQAYPIHSFFTDMLSFEIRSDQEMQLSIDVN